MPQNYGYEYQDNWLAYQQLVEVVGPRDQSVEVHRSPRSRLKMVKHEIEGDLKEEYKQMTGRQFLDAFDLVISPTKADEYKHKQLRQVRANDKALTNVIYGSGLKEETNQKTKTWEGIINDDEQQKTIVNMGMGKKAEVPKKLEEFNGKNGSSINKLSGNGT